MIVRPAGVADIATIRAIALVAWPVAYATILTPEQMAYMLERMYSMEALEEQLQVKGHRFLIAVQDDASIGFASYSTGYAGANITRLHKLYLLPQKKGGGTGRMLLNAVAEAALEAGDVRLNLNVNRFNPSVNFYKHTGFRVVKEEVIDIGAGYVMDDFVMERALV